MTYVAEIADRLDIMSSVKVGGFGSQLDAPCMFIHTEAL